jgi:biotin carboxyl carrier protein
MKHSITVNGKAAIKTDLHIKGNNFEGTLDDKIISGNLIKINDYQFHLIHNNTSYNVDVMRVNHEEKTMTIKINSVTFDLALKDKYDELLHSLGMDSQASKKVAEVRAPMPGMVLNLLVEEGAVVKKGDALIVLEAMKMENILKSPSDGTIKKITAIKGKAVEKNEILIQF